MAKKIRGTAKKAAAARAKAAIVDIAPQTITATPASGSKPARVNVATTITVQSVPAPAAPAQAAAPAPSPPPAQAAPVKTASAITHNVPNLAASVAETTSPVISAPAIKTEPDKALTNEISALSDTINNLANANAVDEIANAINTNPSAAPRGKSLGKKLDIIGDNIGVGIKTTGDGVIKTNELLTGLGISMTDSSEIIAPTAIETEPDKALTDEISGLSDVTKKLTKANTSMVVKAIEGNTVNTGKKLDIISGNLGCVIRTADKDMLETGKLFSRLGISMADSSRDTKDKLIKELERMTELLDTPSISTEERLETIKHREDLLEALGKLEFKPEKEKKEVKGPGGWFGTIVAITGLLTGLIVGFVQTVLKDLGRIKFTGIRKFFTGIGDKFRAMKDSFKNSKFMTSVKDFFTGIGDKFKRIKEFFNFKGFTGVSSFNPFTKIKDFFTGIGEKFMKFFRIGKTIGRVLGKLALPLTILMSVYDGIMGAIDGYKTGGIAGAIKGAVLGVFNGLAGWVWDGIMWIFKSIYRYFGDDAAANALEAWDFMSTITWLWDSIQGFIEAIITPFVWMFNKIGEYLDDPMKIFSDIWEGIKAIPGLIWSGIKGLWGLFKGIGKTILAWFLPDRFSWLGKIVAKTGIYEKLGISGSGGSEKEKLTDETANNIVAERKAKNEALRARGLKPDGVTPIGKTPETPTPAPPTPAPPTPTPAPPPPPRENDKPPVIKATRELTREEYGAALLAQERAENDSRGGPVKIRSGTYDYAGEDGMSDEEKQELKTRKFAEAIRRDRDAIKPVQTNSTGAEINQISKSNKEMQSAPIIIAAPAPASGGGGKGSTNTNNVSSVTYQNNNIPDRSFTFNRGALAAY